MNSAKNKFFKFYQDTNSGSILVYSMNRVSIFTKKGIFEKMLYHAKTVYIIQSFHQYQTMDMLLGKTIYALYGMKISLKKLKINLNKQ